MSDKTEIKGQIGYWGALVNSTIWAATNRGWLSFGLSLFWIAIALAFFCGNRRAAAESRQGGETS